MGAVVARSAAERRLFGVGKRTRVPKLANADEVNRMRRLMSAYGHKADMLLAFRHVRFWGVKQTLVSHSAMSAFDPKRTSTGIAAANKCV